jgi:hypothetical protein
MTSEMMITLLRTASTRPEPDFSLSARQAEKKAALNYIVFPHHGEMLRATGDSGNKKGPGFL